MLISTLIAHLNAVIAEAGDMDVVCEVNYYASDVLVPHRLALLGDDRQALILEFSEDWTEVDLEQDLNKA